MQLGAESGRLAGTHALDTRAKDCDQTTALASRSMPFFLFIAIELIAGMWLHMAYVAWTRKSTWQRFEMRWVKSKRGSKSYYFDAVTFGLMGLAIMSVGIWGIFKGV